MAGVFFGLITLLFVGFIFLLFYLVLVSDLDFFDNHIFARFSVTNQTIYTISACAIIQWRIYGNVIENAIKPIWHLCDDSIQDWIGIDQNQIIRLCEFAMVLAYKITPFRPQCEICARVFQRYPVEVFKMCHVLQFTVAVEPHP